MKKKSAFAIFASLSILLLGCATIAQSTDIEKGFVSVSSSSSKEVAPSQVEISMGVETSDISLKKATENNKLAANKVYSAIKSVIGNDGTIKTGSYSIRPQYVYTKDNKKVLDKYLVSNTVVIKTKKLDAVSKLIDSAVAQGATKIENLQFSVVDYDNTCNEALSELSKKAYSQADTIAKAVNSQITGIKSINATCNQENNARPYFGGLMAMKSANEDSAISTPIESGKIKIDANIDASFFLK